MWYFKKILFLLTIGLIVNNTYSQKIIFHPNKMNIDKGELSISGIYFEINLVDSTILESYENYHDKSKMSYYLERGIIYIEYNSKNILFHILQVTEKESFSKLIYINRKGGYDFHFTGEIEIILRDG